MKKKLFTEEQETGWACRNVRPAGSSPLIARRREHVEKRAADAELRAELRDLERFPLKAVRNRRPRRSWRILSA